jgi:hypothetical protein
MALDIQHAHRAPTTRPYLPSDRILNDTDRAASTEPRAWFRRLGNHARSIPHLIYHTDLMRSPFGHPPEQARCRSETGRGA